MVIQYIEISSWDVLRMAFTHALICFHHCAVKHGGRNALIFARSMCDAKKTRVNAQGVRFNFLLIHLYPYTPLIHLYSKSSGMSEHKKDTSGSIAIFILKMSAFSIYGGESVHHTWIRGAVAVSPLVFYSALVFTKRTRECNERVSSEKTN